MDRIEKALKKLTSKERTRAEEIFVRLSRGDTKHLDIKKLKGREDIFRVRKGSMRIMYRKDKQGNIFILTLDRRDSTTYKS